MKRILDSLPNLLSAFRLLLAGLFPFCREQVWIWLVLAAGASDFLDGWIARRWHLESWQGGLLDAVADKLFVLSVLGLWLLFIAVGYFLGKRLENDPVLNRTHVLISAGLTVMFILLVALQQRSVGNLGPKSDTRLCNDFCVQHGYPASGMPPQISGDCADRGKTLIGK